MRTVTLAVVAPVARLRIVMRPSALESVALTVGIDCAQLYTGNASRALCDGEPMREIVSIHVGLGGWRIGTGFWQILCDEHKIEEPKSDIEPEKKSNEKSQINRDPDNNERERVFFR